MRRACMRTSDCARANMENCIKEQQMGLFSDRASSSSFRANDLRLWFSAVGYVLMHDLRRVGLAGTEMASAQCVTIRTKLLKIGALVRVSVRRIRLYLSSAYPYQELFARILQNLRVAYPILRL